MRTAAGSVYQDVRGALAVSRWIIRRVSTVCLASCRVFSFCRMSAILLTLRVGCAGSVQILAASMNRGRAGMEQLGDQLAFVVLEDGAHITADVLEQHVREPFVGVKGSCDISLLDHLLPGNGGKVLRASCSPALRCPRPAMGARHEPVRCGTAATQIE